MNSKRLAKRVYIDVSVTNTIDSSERLIKGNELNVIASVLNITSNYQLGRTDNPNPTDSHFANEKDEQLMEYMKDLTVWQHNEPGAEKDIVKFRRTIQTYNRYQ